MSPASDTALPAQEHRYKGMAVSTGDKSKVKTKLFFRMEHHRKHWFP